MASHEQSVAVVLAAHGDRGGDGGNKHLATHANEISEEGNFAGVFHGVLNGEPSLENALAKADGCGASQIIVYPVFMSPGYFVKTVLADRVAAAGLKTPTGIMQPLGLDQRLAMLMLEHALRTTKSAEIDPAEARLLIVGHGSKQGSESADATKRAARLLSSHSPYLRVETAFIEEEPFLKDALSGYDGTSVVAGFLSGDGLHAGEDIPEAIKQTGARALYTGPIGLHPRVPGLIVSSISKALDEQDESEVAADVAPSSASAPAAPVAMPEAEDVAPTPETVSEDVAAKIRASMAKSESRSEPEPEPEPQPQPKPAPVMKEATVSGLETPPADTEEIPPAPKPEKSKAAAKRARRRASPLRLALKAVTVLVMMAILGAVAIPFFVSEDVIREQAISQFNQKTGRTLTIAGKTSFALFPNVGVEMEDVSISNPPDMAQGEMLRMKALNLNLKLIPLFSKSVQIDRFVLDQPVFNLVVDKNGNRNWDFKKLASLRQPKATNVGGLRQKMIFAQASGASSAVREISLGTLAMNDGTVNFTDQATGVKHQVKAMNITVVQPRLDEPLDANGDLVWEGEKVEFDGWLEDIPALMREKSSGARFNFTTRHAKGSFEGAFSVAPQAAAKGVLKTESPSIRDLSSWLGNPLPPGGGLGPLAIKGDLSFIGETLTFSKAQLSIDGMNGDGNVVIRLKGVRPFVTATLNMDKLDLNQYAEDQPQATRAVSPTAPIPSQGEQAPKPQSGGSLTDFIKKLENDPSGKPKPQVRAWSQEAVDYSGLRAVDADLKLSAKTILLRNIKTGVSDVDANIRSGVLTANLTRLLLYSGTGTGKVVLNGARAVPGLSATFNLNGISALPLLTDVADFKWVSGKTNLALSVAGSGRSQTEIMRSLQGNGQFAFGDGAIEGINIPELARGIKQGRFDGWKRNDREKTDFSQLTASFNIQNGVADNRDLVMVGPLLRLTGGGTIDIGNERLDYSALPRLVASIEGQGAQIEQGRGIAIPVKVSGPWERPKVKVDLERLMNDPELAQNAINEVGKALENKEELNNILKGLLGGGNQQNPNGAAPGQQGQQGQQINPNDLLKNLFKKN